MTKPDQREALAKMFNWTKAPYNDTDYYVPMMGKVAVPCDPLEDLNLANSIEESLTERERLFFMRLLLPNHLDSQLTNSGAWSMCHASAPSRIRAFLKTKLLWDDL